MYNNTCNRAETGLMSHIANNLTTRMHVTKLSMKYSNHVKSTSSFNSFAHIQHERENKLYTNLQLGSFDFTVKINIPAVAMTKGAILYENPRLDSEIRRNAKSDFAFLY